MSEFERQSPSYRLANTHHGDDLPAIAAREMGDANRWQELVWINKLRWPYITNDPRRVEDGVLLAGDFIRVPAPRGVWTDDARRGQVYERDCEMAGRMLQATDGGDFAVVAGSANLRQQLQHRLDTPRGQMRRHPEYGNLVQRLKGTVNRNTAAMLAAEYTKSTLSADYRVASVESASAQVQADSARVSARVVAIDGGSIDLVSEI